MPSPYREIFVGVIASIMLLALAFAYIISILHLIKSLKSKQWPLTKGVIENSGIQEITDYDGTSYEAKVIYSYVVNGKYFESDNIAFWGILSLSKVAAKRYQSSLTKNDEVKVYYNPINPDESTLYVGLNRNHIHSIIYVVIVTIVFVYYLISLVH